MPVGINYLHYAKSVFRPKHLESVFLFVTSTCNSLCRTCFYWHELNQGRDLAFEQLDRISPAAPPFHKLPPFRKLWISGGEPFRVTDAPLAS
jgi:L-lysine 2,3-aminomutase